MIEPPLTQRTVDEWNARVEEVYQRQAAARGITVEEYRRQEEASP